VSFDASDTDALVLQRVRASGSSFYWAMRLLDERRRRAMYAVYAFCRDVDDIVDEPGTEFAKQAALQAWRDDIAALFAGGVPHQPLAGALLGPIRSFDLQQEDFQSVIEGCAMDAGAGVVRPSMAVLDLYCDRVASAVGRLSVRVFGATGPSALDVAYHQGRALQLTNILRDVAVDAAIGRLYLPDELLAERGIGGTDIPQILAHPALPEVCRALGAKAQDHFDRARAAMAKCPPGAMRPAVVMLEMYAAILRRCAADGWQPSTIPPSLPKAAKIWCAIRYGLL
jgi:phytoene synthase